MHGAQTDLFGSPPVRERITQFHRKPLVGVRDTDGFRSFRVPLDRARAFQFVQLGRTGSAQAAIVLDVDDVRRIIEMREGWADPYPAPNWTVTNPATGHIHVVYALRNPVHVYPEAKTQPVKYLIRVSEYLSRLWLSDAGYSGILTRNPDPVKPFGDVTFWGRSFPYPLDELADWIPASFRVPRRDALRSAEGRNCTIFSELMLWAGSKANAETPVLREARRLNTFQNPLPASEIRATARSVERYREQWRAHNWHCPAWIERQRLRGRASGKARRKRTEGRDARIIRLRAEGLKQWEIAEAVGVSQQTVSRVNQFYQRTNTDKAVTRGLFRDSGGACSYECG